MKMKKHNEVISKSVIKRESVQKTGKLPDCTDPQPTEEKTMESLKKIESYAITEIQYFHRQGKDYDYCKEHEVRSLESEFDIQSAKLKEQADEIDRLEIENKQHKDSVLMFMKERNNALYAHDLAVKEQYRKSNECDFLKSENRELSLLLSEAIEALKRIRKFTHRLPTEWYPEAITAHLDGTLKKLEQFTKDAKK